MKHELIYEKNGTIVLKIIGQIEYEDRGALSSKMENIYEQGNKLVILELSATNYIGSAGIGVITKYHKRFTNNGGKLLLLNAQNNVKKMLENIGLSGRLDMVFGSYEEVIEREVKK